MIPTNTTTIVVCEEVILIWGIPRAFHLTWTTGWFFRSTVIPLIFYHSSKVTFPKDFAPADSILALRTDALPCGDSKLCDFEIVIKPGDLSDVCLNKYHEYLSPLTPYDSDDLLSRKYHICDNTIVYWVVKIMVLQRYSTVEYTFDQWHPPANPILSGGSSVECGALGN